MCWPSLEDLDREWSRLTETKARCLELARQVEARRRAQRLARRPGGLGLASERRLDELAFGPGGSGAPAPGAAGAPRPGVAAPTAPPAR